MHDRVLESGGNWCSLPRLVATQRLFERPGEEEAICGGVACCQSQSDLFVRWQCFVCNNSFVFLCRNNVRRQQAADHQALDVAHGVPPPRAAPPLLRRVVLNRSSPGTRRSWYRPFGRYYSSGRGDPAGDGPATISLLVQRRWDASFVIAMS